MTNKQWELIMSNNKKLLVVSKNGKLALSKIDGSLLTNFEYDSFDNSLSSYIIATRNKKQEYESESKISEKTEYTLRYPPKNKWYRGKTTFLCFQKQY